ncbi:MAG: hypothetical protein FWD95_18260, partial [Nocardioidaceae bacterium]|nr:hypothetical protein [Nocardioidaceae bacterium]
MNATARIPQATLRDEWTVAVTQRWARAFTASTTVSRASGAADRTVAEPARRGSAPAEAAQ